MKRSAIILLACAFLFAGCETDDESLDTSIASDTSSGGSQTGDPNQSGLITAGEWNDLENWLFWNDIVNQKEFAANPDTWGFYNTNRISVLINSNNQPLTDAKITLIIDGNSVWESKSDNSGKAELWIDLFQENQSVDISEYSLEVNGQAINIGLKPFSEGVNVVDMNTNQTSSERVELNFIVDATGSMSDELEFLKDDLADVIQRVKDSNSSLDIFTSSVFYRDEGDEYEVRSSDFTDDINTTLSFINNQSADGGGDFPEAVHSALKVGIEEFQWSENAKTRIAFLLLDAPPHEDPNVVQDLQKSITEASKKGIKIIPISASGIGKNTEFLMRFFSITTNSTYVFLTNDSGIGGNHIEPTVGDYEVEFLNDLMVRLIKEYSE